MKAGKRALGSVFQRAQDGRWVVRVTLPTGKRITRYSTDKKAAEQLLAQLLTTPDLAPAAPYTVASWVAAYLVRANQGKARATVQDRLYSERKITAGLGSIRLDKLTPAGVQRWADGLTGGHRTQLKALQLLRSALTEAVALGHLQRNPALPVKLPRQPQKMAGTSWTQVQARQFLTTMQGTQHEYLWLLALQTGARIGELLALRLGDYDPAAKTLRIERTVKLGEGSRNRTTVGPPKTVNAHRSFPLPLDARQTLEAQIERVEQLRAKCPDWQREGWLFPTGEGRLLIYSNVSRAWGQALTRVQAELTAEWVRAGSVGQAPVFPRIRLHDLRVTFISLALRRGVKPEVVARMVGHSSPLITLRIYRQVFQDELDDTRELLAGMI